MNRQQNRPRNRDDYDKFNRNRQRNNDDRRRSDGGNGGWRRNDQDGRMTQSRGGGGGGGGGYGQMNMGGYSQNMPTYGQQNQMSNYGGFGNNAPAFQQNRFGMNQQQRISPWANNMMPGMATCGEEAKLAMNILNAVLSSGGSGRGMSPPPNKMRRMDHREGGYDDRRRRPRSPPGRSSHPNRQQSSQRFGSDRRGRDGYSSNQRNDDHRFRNSVNKNPGIARSSKQSSGRSSEVVQRRQSFVEREKETKEYSDLPVKALKCRMCDKSEFHNVAAYLAHVHSKGHAKVAKAYHEKIAALTTLLKQNAKLALHKELIRVKASGKKANEKECRVCEAPMVYGNLKHKNILACKILHKFTNQTLCCGKDHKYRNIVESHCLTLAHLKAKYESECQSEEKEVKPVKPEEPAEDEHEKISRQKRDEARRKRKFGDDETDEEEEEDEEEENEENEERDAELNNGNEKREEDNVAEENQEQRVDEVEKMETNEEEVKVAEEEDKKRDSSSAVDEEVETSQDEKKEEGRKGGDNSSDQIDNKDQKQQQNDRESSDTREDDKDDRRGKMLRNRNNNRKDIDPAKFMQQMSLQELQDYHKKFLVDDPEKLGPYDPANPIGLNYIETHVAYHCMACIEYYPAAIDELMTHCCSKDHYKMFRSKYMKLQGVRDSPTSLSRLKAAREREIKTESERSQERDTKDRDNQVDEKNDDREEGDHKEGVAGDDALYDPYEGESGDLTTLLQDKKSDEDPENRVPEGFETKEEVHLSEPENYEDNILDYDEDVGEDAKDDDEDDDNEHQQEDERYEADEFDDNDDNQDDENTESRENDEYQRNENEVYRDDEKADYDEEKNYNEREDERDEYREDEDDDNDDEETPSPPVPARRGRSKRVFF